MESFEGVIQPRVTAEQNAELLTALSPNDVRETIFSMDLTSH